MREYRLQRRVEFAETDAAGIAHFTAFFRYMEEAEHALWRDAGMSIHPRDGDLGWPRVSATFDYHRPLYFEDEFEVRIAVMAVTSRTIRYECHVTRGDTKIATGALTIACVRRHAGALQAIEIPTDIASRLRM
jgi:acyl-CoA thioester hydrolase